MIEIAFLSFNALTLDSLYDVMDLRNAVFIVEQQCFYQDLDYPDQLAKHLLIHEDKKLIAYARILSSHQENSLSFGWLVVAPLHRGKGFAKKLMELILHYLEERYPQQLIKISAQTYLQNFYQNYGFQPEGDVFDLGDILHVTMVRER